MRKEELEKIEQKLRDRAPTIVINSDGFGL